MSKECPKNLKYESDENTNNYINFYKISTNNCIKICKKVL